MSDTKTSETQPAKQATDSDSVSRAAAELGVAVPRGFWLVGVGEDGLHLSGCAGGAADFRVAAAICRRLDGVPIADCWADPVRSEDKKPAWAPPDDWSDTEAVLAYLAERDQHPEWPRFFNSWGDVMASLANPGVATTVTAVSLAARAGFRAIDTAITQRGQTQREQLRQQGETERAGIAQRATPPRQEPPASAE